MSRRFLNPVFPPRRVLDSAALPPKGRRGRRPPAPPGQPCPAPIGTPGGPPPAPPPPHAPGPGAWRPRPLVLPRTIGWARLFRSFEWHPGHRFAVLSGNTVKHVGQRHVSQAIAPSPSSAAYPGLASYRELPLFGQSPLLGRNHPI